MCGYLPEGIADLQKESPTPGRSKVSKEVDVTPILEVKDDLEEDQIFSEYSKKRIRELSNEGTSKRNGLAGDDDVDQHVSQVLNQKLLWAASKLENEESIEGSLQLSELLKSLAETKIVFRKLSDHCN
jgi:hypothetical protein